MSTKKELYLGLLVMSIFWAFFSGSCVVGVRRRRNAWHPGSLGILLRGGFSERRLLLREAAVRESDVAVRAVEQGPEEVRDK